MQRILDQTGIVEFCAQFSDGHFAIDQHKHHPQIATGNTRPLPNSLIPDGGLCVNEILVHWGEDFLAVYPAFP
jgi:hypothetical protein